ncbi:MAG: 2-amino-4-hydroxy-6-hydroxymethyldihydropteridine diphosphokinase [Bacteroidota bacterium]
MTDGIFILLGSNLGDRRKNVEDSLILIKKRVGAILKMSSLYETAPWGVPDQPRFLNMVIEIESVLNPQDLLSSLLEIEDQLGRVRKTKWGERLIDIDILYYGNVIIKEKNLILPHPEIQNRRFTLIPLVEIAPSSLHPILKKSNIELLSSCTDKLEVTILQ